MRIKIMSNYDVWQNFIKIVENYNKPVQQNKKMITKETSQAVAKTLEKDCFVKTKEGK